MKRILLAAFAVLIFCVSTTHAQNLVVNPSFENTSSNCANFGGEGFTTDLLDWDDANSSFDSCSSPDLFAPCNSLPFFGSPTNMPNSGLGYQNSHSGTHHVGIITHSPGNNYREYIQGRTTTPLVAGQNYCVSMYISLANTMPYATNNIGIRFTSTNYQRDACVGNYNNVINQTPQLNYDCTPILDTTENWVRLQWSYTATGGEQYFQIGNFFNTAGTTVANTGFTGGTQPYAYYYIDDVSIVANTCCDADIKKAGPFCQNDYPVNLSVIAPITGVTCSVPTTGVWSGPGIIDANAGTFSPVAAGVGTHTITYTLSCGKAVTTTIVVQACTNLIVCKENGGNLKVADGTAPYKWQRQVVTQDCSNCQPAFPPFIAACSIPPGCAITTVSWVDFATGSTATPPGTYPIRVVDATNKITVINDFASLYTCPNCPTITVTNPTKQNVTCPSTNNGSATVAASGGASPYTYAWSGGAGSGATKTNLSAGTYTVTATDANQCTGTTTVTITAPSSPTLTFSNKVQPGCGQANGSVSATLAGGSPPYQVNINNGSTSTNQTVPIATTAPLNNLAAGTYTISVTDGGGCTTVQTITFTAPPAPVIFVISSSPTNCLGASDGTAYVGANSGTPPFSYLWSNTQTTPTITGLAAGNYVVTVTDAVGCKDTGNVTVSNGPICCTINLSASATQPGCGQSNGSITISATPAATYSYAWSGGLPATATQSNLPSGQYFVTVSNTSVPGCTKDTSIILTNPNGPALSFSNKVEPGCGQANGSVNVTLSGGTASYQVTVDNGTAPTTQTLPFAGTAPLNNLPAGTYIITVVDASSCSTTQTIVFTEPAGPAISSVTSIPPTCQGGTDGTATVAASGGTGALTYVWSNTQTTPTITALTAGSYIVTVSDAAGCKDTGTVSVAAGPVCCTLNISATAVQPACGQSNGSISISATPAATYSYTWSGGLPATATQSNLPSGQYFVTVSNTSVPGCTKDTSIILTNPNGPALSFSNKVEPGCGQANGSINVTLSGGTAPYQVTVDNGTAPTTQTLPFAGTAPLNNLPAGTYIITVVDASSCSTTQTIVFTEPAGPTISSVTSTPPTCQGGTDGTATVSASGGTGTLTYVWSNTQTTPTITALTAGSYIVTVSDAAGCKDTGTVSVANGPVCCTLNIFATAVQPACGQSNGSISISATPAATYSYTWSGGLPATATQSNLPSGQYFVTVSNTSISGCTKDTSIVLTNPNGPALSFAGKAEPGCGQANGSVNVTLSGGTAPYQVTVDNGSTPTTQTLPFAGTAPLNNLPAGTYIITVVDVSSCSTTQTIVFSEPAGPAITSVTSTPTTCAGGSDGTATVTATGGTGTLTYVWSNTQTTPAITGLATGNFIVTVSDAAGCKDTGNVAVADGPVCCNIGISAVLTQPGCGLSNGSIVPTISGSGNYSFAWSNTATTKDITNVSAGNYTLTVTDITQGCSRDSVFSLSNPNAPVISGIMVTPVSCGATNDGSITVSASSVNGADPNTAYTWSNSSTEIDSAQTNLAAGNYSFTITDLLGCKTSGSAVVTNTINCCGVDISATSTGPDCGQNNATIDVVMNAAGTAPYSYSINGTVYQPGNTFSNLAAGTYSVYVSDATGCGDTTTITIAAVNNTLVLNLQHTDPGCSGIDDGTVTALVSGGSGAVSFTWSNNAGNVAAQANLAAGTYSVTVSDAAGCSQASSATLNAAQAIVLDLNDTVICAGDNFVLSAPAGYTSYIWGAGQVSEGIRIDSTDTYSVTVTDANGCTATDFALVRVVPAPVITMPADTGIFENNDIQLAPAITGNTAGATYVWQPDKDLSCNDCASPLASPDDTITYLLSYTSVEGCRASASITINIQTGTNLFVPNLFSPNGDGDNDILRIFAIGLKEMNWKVFNRWGEMVFQSTDINVGWDGNYNGLMQPPGVYVYVVELTYLNKKKKLFTGGLTLVR